MRIPTAAIISMLLLSGCTTDADKGLCPSAAVLAGTSVLTVFRSDAPADPSGELFTAEMTNIKTECDYNKGETTSNSSLDILFRASRQPSSEAANYKIPYYVAVTQGGSRILTKQLFTAHFAFQPGETTTTFDNTIASTVIKLAHGHKIGEYLILAGLQLTHEQLDYDRKMGRYSQ